MKHPKFSRRWLAVTVAAAAATGMIASPAIAAPPNTGPTTNVDPYILGVGPGVATTSLLTVNDLPAGNGYRMVGIPDGLGAFLNSNGRVVVQMNHELQATAGIARRHGKIGSFVSRVVLNPANLAITSGKDLISPDIKYWDYAAGAYTSTVPAGQIAEFGRFCSSSLTDPGQLFNAATGNGTRTQIYFANEETGNEGRVFGVLPNGVTRALPRLGLFSWENTIAAPNQSDTTLVMGQEDGGVAELWAYVGRKKGTGSEFFKAGLTNGVNYTVKLPSGQVTDAAFRAAYNAGDAVPFVLTHNEWNQTGAAQNAEAVADGALALNRIEDGAFDPNNKNDFYFVTTSGGEGTGTGGGGGLWKLSWTNIEQPLLGGTLTLILDGTQTFTTATGTTTIDSPDNLEIDSSGNILIQEDPGNNVTLAEILAYRISDGARAALARFDANRFLIGGSSYMGTQDEESSGIIDVEDIMPRAGKDGVFLFDAQIHTSTGLPAGTGPGTVQELVENGQLLLLEVDDWAAVYAAGV